MRSWLREVGSAIGTTQVEEFSISLSNRWKRRYEQLSAGNSAVGPIYAAVNLLQEMEVPLKTDIIVDFAVPLKVGKSYHISESLDKRLRNTLGDWRIINPRYSRWLQYHGGAVFLISVLSFYMTSLMIFRFVPGDWIHNTNIALASFVKDGLVFIAFLYFFLLLFIISRYARSFIRWRNRRQIQKTIANVISHEVPIRDDELRPYEAQFTGYRSVNTWTLSEYAGRWQTPWFVRFMSLQWANLHLLHSRKLRESGDSAPALSLPRRATQFAKFLSCSLFDGRDTVRSRSVLAGSGPVPR